MKLERSDTWMQPYDVPVWRVVSRWVNGPWCFSRTAAVWFWVKVLLDIR